MFKEFKAFVNQGNALDLAVGVLIGAAFGKIVNSVVTDLITPILSLLLLPFFRQGWMASTAARV